MRKLHLGVLTVLALFFVACSSDDNTTDSYIPMGEYSNGIFIVNEGNFGAGNSEISFIDSDLSGVSSGIFGINNAGESLGDVAQSMAFYEDLAFIVVNNSDKVVVVDRHTFKKIAIIDEGLSLPRYMAVANHKGYITNWGESDNAFISVVDLDSFEVIKTIDIDFGAEKIVAHADLLYVAHQGGFGQNNKLSVISAGSDSVYDVIEVGDSPNSLQIVNNDLWVLSSGNPSWAAEGETEGSLLQLDLGSLEVKKSFSFTSDLSPNLLEYDQGNLYYTLSMTDWDTYETESHIYELSPEDVELPIESIFSTDRSFYGATIKNGLYYGGDAKDYASNGSVVVYDLSSGDEVYEFVVGISPNGFYFTE